MACSGHFVCIQYVLKTIGQIGLDRPSAHYRPPLVEVQSVLCRLLQDERRKVRVSLIDREVIIPLLLLAKGVMPMQGI